MPGTGRGNTFANGPSDKYAGGSMLAAVRRLVASELWDRI